uniref:Uncharacterized protein n=1 Tax=Setaria viridis TaxID=4556 RepID=A0A4U6TKF5_SETVI|nr:hypothetical protein SEVIR_8G180932v2 [Setaria viridis]
MDGCVSKIFLYDIVSLEKLNTKSVLFVSCRVFANKQLEVDALLLCHKLENGSLILYCSILPWIILRLYSHLSSLKLQSCYGGLIRKNVSIQDYTDQIYVSLKKLFVSLTHCS